MTDNNQAHNGLHIGTWPGAQNRNGNGPPKAIVNHAASVTTAGSIPGRESNGPPAAILRHAGVMARQYGANDTNGNPATLVNHQPAFHQSAYLQPVYHSQHSSIPNHQTSYLNPFYHFQLSRISNHQPVHQSRYVPTHAYLPYSPYPPQLYQLLPYQFHGPVNYAPWAQTPFYFERQATPISISDDGTNDDDCNDIIHRLWGSQPAPPDDPTPAVAPATTREPLEISVSAPYAEIIIPDATRGAVQQQDESLIVKSCDRNMSTDSDDVDDTTNSALALHPNMERDIQANAEGQAEYLHAATQTDATTPDPEKEGQVALKTQQQAGKGCGNSMNVI